MKKKLIMITTVPLSLKTLVKGQPKYLSNFFDTKLITSYSPANKEISEYEGVEVISINMTRKITIYQDLKSLYEMYLFLRKEKPDIVYTFTPKAGLLGMIAAFLAKVPVRIHNVVGMPLMEAKAKKKTLLKYIEKITYLFSTRLFCNSFGLKEFMQKNLTSKAVTVIGYGSINGVDVDYFQNKLSQKEQHIIREVLRIDEDDFVITFVGRIVKDKGINELVEAFLELKNKYSNLKLLLVGDYEEHLNPIEKKNKNLIDTREDIITPGFQKDIRKYLAITDLFVLPSYREGLPNSLIEAGSFGIPLLASNINGCNEIIIDRTNGILVKKKDKLSLKKGIELLLNDKDLYFDIKSNVRRSIIERYEQKYFLEELRREIESSF